LIDHDRADRTIALDAAHPRGIQRVPLEIEFLEINGEHRAQTRLILQKSAKVPLEFLTRLSRAGHQNAHPRRREFLVDA